MGKIATAKRSERRHHLERMKTKAKNVGKVRGLRGNWDKHYNHLAVCSCHMCGNPRRHWNEPTMQEQRFFAALIYG